MSLSTLDGDIEHKWYVADATDVVLGRPPPAADLLRGRASLPPQRRLRRHVIVINADKIHISSNKRTVRCATPLGFRWRSR